MGEGRHIDAALVQTFQDGSFRLVCHFVGLGAAGFESALLQASHHVRRRGRSGCVNDRIDLRRSAETELSVTSAAIQPVQVRALQTDTLLRGFERESLQSRCGLLWAGGQKSRRAQALGFSHAGVSELSIQVGEPAFAAGRSNLDLHLRGRLTDKCGNNHDRHE